MNQFTPEKEYFKSIEESLRTIAQAFRREEEERAAEREGPFSRSLERAEREIESLREIAWLALKQRVGLELSEKLVRYQEYFGKLRGGGGDTE